MFLPNDTITATFQSTTTYYTIISGTADKTILSIRTAHSSGDLRDILYCGSIEAFSFNTGNTTTGYDALNYVCKNEIKYKNGDVGNPDNVVVNYILRDRTITADPYQYSTSTVSSTTVSTINGFTQGEILTNLFLVVFRLAWIVKFIIEKVKYDHK